MGIAYGHEVYDRAPDAIFELKWDWDPTLIFFALILVFYARSLKRFKKQPVETWQKGLFYLGVSILIVALIPPIDPLSDQLFFMHMIQHLMITHVGIPLMLFGVPFFVIIRGVPNWFRKGVYFPILRSKVFRFLNRIFSNPVFSLALFEINYWFWHVPKFYNMALLNDVIHLVEHGCFAVTSLFLWKNIIDPYPLKSPLPLPARILFLGFIMAINIILSAILTLSDEILYAYEGIPLPSFWEKWGHLQDQRVGGLIMWIPGGLVTFISMTIVFFVWANREEKKDLAMRKKRELEQAGQPALST